MGAAESEGVEATADGAATDATADGGAGLQPKATTPTTNAAIRI